MDPILKRRKTLQISEMNDDFQIKIKIIKQAQKLINFHVPKSILIGQTLIFNFYRDGFAPGQFFWFRY